MASAPAPDGSADLSVILSDAGWNKGFPLERLRAGAVGPSVCTHMVPTEKGDINHPVAF